jgi:hypothetical protein
MVEAFVEGSSSINAVRRPTWRAFALEAGIAPLIVSDPVVTTGRRR